jgi:hypothetical protein
MDGLSGRLGAPHKTFSEDLQRVRTGNQPSAYAAIRNLVIGAFRQHRPRPPLLRPRRPAHPRPLRIHLKQAPGTPGHITQMPCRGSLPQHSSRPRFRSGTLPKYQAGWVRAAPVLPIEANAAVLPSSNRRLIIVDQKFGARRVVASSDPVLAAVAGQGTPFRRRCAPAAVCRLP